MGWSLSPETSHNKRIQLIAEKLNVVLFTPNWLSYDLTLKMTIGTRAKSVIGGTSKIHQETNYP